MALTKVTGHVVKTDTNVHTHNINSSGIVTAIGLDVSGNVSVGGTLTYQDVTSVDSVGIITARAGIIDSTLTAGRVVYVDSDKSLTDSAKLTYDGTTITNENTGGAANLVLKTTVNSFNSLKFDSNRAADTQFAIIDGRWNGNDVARIQFVTGSDGTNKDDGYMAFHTRTSGANLAEALQITSSGVLKLTGQSTSFETAGLTHHTNNNLYIRGGTTGAILQNVDGQEAWIVQNDYLSASTSGAERLRINNSGHIGIKTTGVFNGALLSIGVGQGANIPSGEHIKIAPSANTITFLDSANNGSDTGNIQFWNTVYNNCAAKIEFYHPAANLGGIKFHTKPAAGGTPVEALRIDHEGIIWANHSNPLSSSLMILDKDGSGEAQLRFYNAGSNKAQIALDNSEELTFDVNGGERLRIDSDGHLGVGDDNPDTRLSVKAASGTDVVGKFTSTDAKAWIQFRDNSTTDTGVMIGAEGDDLMLRAGSNERLRISSDGIVRIKRTATTTLDNDSIYLSLGGSENGANSNRMIGFGYVQNLGDSVYPASMGYTETSNTSHTKGALVFNTRNTTTYNDAPTERVRITSGGGVSIGTEVSNERVNIHTASSLKAQVQFTNNTTGTGGGDGLVFGITGGEEAIIWNQENTKMSFATNNQSHMTLRSTGQLGIGTAFTPSASAKKLTVLCDGVGDGIHIANKENLYPAGSTGYSDLRFSFYDYLTGGYEAGGEAIIRGYSRNAYTNNRTTDLIFLTSSDDGDPSSGTATEKLRITSSGRVNIANGDQTGSHLDYTRLNVYGQTSNGGTNKNLNLLNVYNYGSGGVGDITGIGLGAGASPGSYTKASIGFIRTGSYGRGDLIFCINSEGNGNQVVEGDERLRITSAGTVNFNGNFTQTTYPVSITTGNVNKKISFGAAAHSDLSNEGSGIFFSRQNDGSAELSGLFSHSNGGFGIATREDMTFHTGGGSTYGNAEERLRIKSTGQVRIDGPTAAAHGLRFTPNGWNSYDNRMGYCGTSGADFWWSSNWNPTDGARDHSGYATNYIRQNISTGYISFGTGGVDASATERLRIDNAGRLHILNNNEDIDMDSNSNGQLNIDGAGYTGAIAMNATGMYLYHNSSTRIIGIGINEEEVGRFTGGGYEQRFSNTTTYSGTTGARKGIYVFNDGATDNCYASLELGATDGDDYFGSTILNSVATGVNYSNDFTIQTRSSGNYNERLRITHDGYVHMYKNAFCRMHLDTSGTRSVAAQSLFEFSLGDGTYNSFNVGSHYKTSGSDAWKFVCPVSGYYIVHMNLITQSTITNGWVAIRRTPVGSTPAYVARTHFTFDSGNWHDVNINTVVSLNVGDKIDFYNHNAMTWYGVDWSWMYIMKIA